MHKILKSNTLPLFFKKDNKQNRVKYPLIYYATVI